MMGKAPAEFNLFGVVRLCSGFFNARFSIRVITSIDDSENFFD